MERCMDDLALALRIVCPTCRAEPGHACIAIGDGLAERPPHVDRIGVARIREQQRAWPA